MSELTRYHFNDMPLRVIVIDGEPWFVLNDACGFLGISNTRDAADRIDQDCVGQTDVADSRGQSRLTNVVNEAGLYELIFRSDKPEAAAFRRWVTREVLPAIRKTGTYSAKPMNDLDLIRAGIDAIEADRARIKVLEAKVSAIEGAHDWFTTLAYAKLNDLPTDRTSCQRHGQRAVALMRRRGQEPVKRQDATFGAINTYPADILEETATS